MSNLATIVNNILADSGIDDINVVVTNGSYSNPAWITALSWSKITGTPTTLGGYGITDAVPSSRTLTINGVSYDLSANRSWNITAGVSSIIAGTGISVSGSGDITVTNTGVLVNDITSSSGQGRFGGWYQGNGYTGAAVEVGYTGGNGYVITYNRATSTYLPLIFNGSNIYLNPVGGRVYIDTSPLVRQSAGVGWLSGNYASSETAATTGAIYSIGGSYFPTGSVLNTMYGIGYTHSAQGQMPSGASSWGFYVAANGVARVWLGGDDGNIIAQGNIYMGISNLVATQSWVNSQGFITGGPYLPLSGGTLTGPVTLNDSTYFRGSPTYGYRFNNYADTLNNMTLTNSSGNLFVRGQIYVGGNGFDSGTQVVYNSGTWGISITGNADTVDGYHATNAASGLAYYASNGYLYVPSWINVDNGGIFSSTNNAHFRPNPGSYGSWLVTGSRNSYRGFEFESGVNGNIALMFNNNSNVSGFYNVSYGWQILWENGTFYIYKNSYGGGTQATVLDSSNYTNWAASVSGSTSVAFSVYDVNYAQTQFNPSAAPRTTNPMSIKMWDNYFAGTGLGSDYGTVLEYYSRGGHVDSQVYFDAGGGSWYRTASYASGFGSWQKYVTENGGTWAISISGSAGSVGGVVLNRIVYGDNSTATTYIAEAGVQTALKSGFYTVGNSGSGYIPTPTSVNFLMHTAYYGEGNLAGFDLLANDSTSSNLYFRPATGGGKGAWQTILTNNNYNSYAPTLTGGGASGTWGINISGTAANASALNSWAYTSYAYRSNGTGYYQISDWIQMNGNFGIYWPSYYGLHLYPNQNTYGALQINGSKNGWAGIYFNDSGNTLMMNSNESGHYREGYGWQFRWYNGGMYVSTNAQGGGSEGTIWHSLNAPRAGNSNLMYYAGFTLDANTMPSNSTGFTYSVNAPYTGPIAKFSEDGYPLQLNATYGGGGTQIAYRTRNGDSGSWNNWYGFITSANISSQSVSYASTAGSAPANGGTATALNSSNYISQTGSTGSWNADFQNTPAGTARYGGDVGSNTVNGPGGSWWIQQNFRHTNSSNYWGVQVAWGWEDNTNRLATRSISGGSFGGWVYYLNSANYSTWAVPISGATLSSTFYFQSNLGAYCGSLSSPPLQAYATGGNSAFMSFHRSGNYAVNMGLDADNVLRIGGWSAAADRWVLDMSGNNTIPGNMSANAHVNGPLGTNRSGTGGNTTSGRVYGPSGAAYSYSGGGITGAIKIRLPFRNNDIMWSMKVRIYNYSTNQTSEYLLGNYAYSAGGYNSSATFIGGSSAPPQVVRFGNDGTYDCVWIGETSTAWSYPVVSVMDFSGGYSNGSIFNYYQNWDVSIVNSFGTVGTTISPDARFNGTFAYYYYDANNAAYYTAPAGTSFINNLRMNGKIRYASSVADDSGFGLYFDNGESTAYAIYREAGSWSWPYPDLRIAFHTGISLGANASYGGIRFFTDYDMSSVVLYVNNGSYGGGGNVYATGSITASSFYEISDARTKTILDENHRVSDIHLIKPKLYKKDGRTELGYIAQDFIEKMPYALTQDGEEQYYSLIYREVHTAKIAYLEDSIEEIKAKILYLENQLKTKQ